MRLRLALFTRALDFTPKLSCKLRPPSYLSSAATRSACWRSRHRRHLVCTLRASVTQDGSITVALQQKSARAYINTLCEPLSTSDLWAVTSVARLRKYIVSLLRTTSPSLTFTTSPSDPHTSSFKFTFAFRISIVSILMYSGF